MRIYEQETTEGSHPRNLDNINSLSEVFGNKYSMKFAEIFEIYWQKFSKMSFFNGKLKKDTLVEFCQNICVSFSVFWIFYFLVSLNIGCKISTHIR